MKKIAVGILCLLFVFAGIFGAGGAARNIVFADNGEPGEPPPIDPPIIIPSGVTMNYYDSASHHSGGVTHQGTVNALYNTTGNLSLEKGRQGRL